MTAADDLWSVWTRAFHPGCLVCRRPLAPEVLQCAHGWTRTLRATRFDPDNTFAACASCHRRHTPAGPAWYRWMRRQLGPERYDRVEQLAQLPVKLRESDLRLVILDAQRRIEALPSGARKAWAIERRDAILARLAKREGVTAAA